MKNQVSRLTIAITVGVFIIFFLLGWMNANIDSYFYWAIGEYFRSGSYPFQAPFVYTKPTTISPPLYGLFFVVTHGIPHTEILLHALQLLFLLATSFLLYRVLRIHITKPYAIAISCLFALYPTNLIYAGNIMTENPSQFIVMLWIYLLVFGITKRRQTHFAFAVLLASAATLLKYNLGILMVFAGVFLVPFGRKITRVTLMCLIGAAGLLITWIALNHRITGTWGLYDTRGTQLYNQFVAQTKLLPPESHPALVRMRSLLPPGTDVAVPYWDIQEKLGVSLQHEWAALDQVLFDVGWASVATHPWQYLIHSVKNYARIHYDHVPHWRNIGNIGVSGLIGTDVPFCGMLGSVNTCRPLISTPWSPTVWNTYVQMEMRLFEVLAVPVFYLMLVPALVFGLLWGNQLTRLYSTAYLVATIPIALTIHPDPRYIVPFYPLAVLIIITSLQRAHDVITHVGYGNKVDNRHKKKERNIDRPL